MSSHMITAKSLANPCKIGIVVARFNTAITDRLYQDAVETLTPLIGADNITVVQVPGAVEIPFALQRLARLKRYDALIAFGAVIYGETDHYHYVSDQVNQGCLRVMLDESIPVVFGVLTTKTMEQAHARAFGHKEFFGKQAAKTALEMVSIGQQIT